MGQSSATPPSSSSFGIVVYLGNGATVSPRPSPFLLCRKKVNALYYEKFQNVHTSVLMLKSMAVGPNNVNHLSHELLSDFYPLWCLTNESSLNWLIYVPSHH
ncbi:hypothetical protein ILYODFUR_002357 [Ilyodon furcidens]|uniref:Uncharacterized protein n=1 Tax=Ilyodon furcidens TaxID=33524 RepID=A0ABV0T8B4_9TELE